MANKYAVLTVPESVRDQVKDFTKSFPGLSMKQFVEDAIASHLDANAKSKTYKVQPAIQDLTRVTKEESKPSSNKDKEDKKDSGKGESK